MTPEPTEAMPPCPFCGHEANVVSDNGRGLMFNVHCGNCRASGPWERCAADAIAAWNKREPEAGKLREALEQIAQHDIGEDLGTSECDNCHDKGFEHYWAVKKIARTALSHNQGDGR